MHEATFDDDLRSDAIAKKHSTMSEAIGVGAAMGARRVILTHFSQRYQKIPGLKTLDTRSINLEDAEDIDDPSADMDQPIEESTLPPATIDESSKNLDETSSHAQPESQPQPQEDVNEPVQPSSSTNNPPSANSPSNINPTSRPIPNEMKVGVAFDGMRVKVCDIMHLDKFTPALMELHKDREDEADGAGKKEAAKEAFADNENDILREAQQRSVKSSEKSSPEEKAERTRKGQVKAAKRREESQKAKVVEKREDYEKGIVGEGTTEEAEVTEPVEEKMKAVQ